VNTTSQVGGKRATAAAALMAKKSAKTSVQVHFQGKFFKSSLGLRVHYYKSRVTAVIKIVIF
jgi:hypothetical protein